MKAKFPYKKRRKRLGRGTGSGHGKTSTRGHKGQRSRSGYSFRPGFEGGQNPLYRRLPKRGFNRAAFQEKVFIVNIDRIAKLEGHEIDPAMMASQGLIKGKEAKVKILGKGTIDKPITVKAHAFSQSAKEKIEKAGGQAVQISN